MNLEVLFVDKEYHKDWREHFSQWAPNIIYTPWGENPERLNEAIPPGQIRVLFLHGEASFEAGATWCDLYPSSAYFIHMSRGAPRRSGANPPHIHVCEHPCLPPTSEGSQFAKGKCVHDLLVDLSRLSSTSLSFEALEAQLNRPDFWKALKLPSARDEEAHEELYAAWLLTFVPADLLLELRETEWGASFIEKLRERHGVVVPIPSPAERPSESTLEWSKSVRDILSTKLRDSGIRDYYWIEPESTP